MRFGEKNTLPLRETRKSIRKSRDCAISRRAVRACPALRFGGFAVLLRLSYGHCAPAYACPPFFNDAGNNALPKARYNRYSRCNLRSPRQNGAPSPRAEEIGGALSPAAQRQRRTRAGVFYRRFMERAKAASRCASARRAAARRRCFCDLVRSSRKRLKRLLA